MRAGTRRRTRRDGFTLVELVVVGFLTVFLSGLMALVWSAYDRAATEVVARCELAQEADFAVAALAEDLAGIDQAGPLVGLRYRDIGADRLELWYDGGPPNGRADWDDPATSTDSVVVYEVTVAADGSATLTRRVGYFGVSSVAAHHVVALRARSLNDPFVQIDLTLRHPLPDLVRKPSPMPLERTYTLIATQP
jgi:type II secretory pathway pseudopilin PulG